MKIIRNMTREPIRVPLGGGKVLHLAPGKTGEVADSAIERPAVVRLVEEGRIEIVDERAHTGPGSGDSGRVREATGPHQRTRVRRTGDR